MEVVFLRDVADVAKAGEVKRVAEGYARNYLIPKGLALAASPAVLKNLESHRKATARREGAHLEDNAAFAATLRGLTVTLKARVGARERLYGSITSADIAAEIQKATGRSVDKRRIDLEEPIKQLGTFEVAVRLTSEFVPKVNVVVEPE